MSFILPTKGQLLTFWLQGGPTSSVGQGAINLVQYVHCIRVYESICKEYVTIQVILYDNNNVIENMGIVPGCQGGFSLRAPPNEKTLSAGVQGGYGTIKVLKMKGEQQPETLKYQVYYVDLIGEVYYADRSATPTNTATAGPQGGTAWIQQIWRENLPDNLIVQTTSSGPAGGTYAPNNKGGQSPLTAIHGVMKEMISDTNSQTGSWVLYKNRDGVNLAQLATLFNGITGVGGGPISAKVDAHGQQEYFIQKETWGAHFNDPDLYHAIIVAQAEVRENSSAAGGGSASGVDISTSAKQVQYVYDWGAGKIVNQGSPFGQLPAIGSSFFLSSVQSFLGSGAGAGVIGGNQTTNSARWPNSTMPAVKTLGERSYSATVKDSPQLVVQAPLQTGLNVTIGKGIWVQLMPPAAGNITANNTILNGPWLVTDLVHELYTDERDVQGTTAMQCVKGPINT